MYRKNAFRESEDGSSREKEEETEERQEEGRERVNYRREVTAVPQQRHSVRPFSFQRKDPMLGERGREALNHLLRFYNLDTPSTDQEIVL